jgi:hypothetical protein
MWRKSVNPFRELLTLCSLIWLYLRVRPNLVHHVALKPIVYGSLAAAMTRRPAILNAITGLGFSFSEGNGALLRRNLVRPLLRVALHMRRSRALIRVAGRAALRKQCRNASAAAHMAKSYLQERYPTKGWATSFSSIDLGQEDFAAEPQLDGLRNRILCEGDLDTWRLVFVGSLSQPYKGGQVLIRAVGMCLQDGLRVDLSLLGDGRHEWFACHSATIVPPASTRERCLSQEDRPSAVSCGKSRC